jgi:hypothetical protein
MSSSYSFEISAYDLKVLVQRLKPMTLPDHPMFHALCLRTDVDVFRGYAADGIRWACQEVYYREKPKRPPDELILPVGAVAAVLQGLPGRTKILKEIGVAVSVRAKTVRLRTPYHSVTVEREDEQWPDFDGMKPKGHEGAARVSLAAFILKDLGAAALRDGESVVHLELADSSGRAPVPFATPLGTFYGGMMPSAEDDDFRVRALAKATVR